MHTLARVCVQRPVFATVLSLSLLVAGIVGYVGLGVDRYPNIDFPFISVSTAFPGASPNEVATEISDKIERRVNTISGIENLSSTSSEGMSVVGIQFALTKDVDVAAEEVRAKVALARRELPKEALEPTVQKADITARPILSFAISSNQSMRDIYEYVDKIVRRRIESVDGVGEVQIIGGRSRQVNLILDPYRLQSYGLTPADISAAISRQNTQVPGGVIEQGDQQLSLRTTGRLTSIDEFNELPINYQGSRQVLLRDVGRAEDGEARIRSIASVDGREAVVIQVVKQSDANAIKVIDAVKERMGELQKRMPKGYEVKVVRDQSTYIEASLHAVREHLILGAILAALVVLLFLGNVRSTVIAALAIPTSILATFGIMRVLGFTQNQVTLLALTLSVGIVIDDAIVVLENIFRVLETERLSPVEAAIRATREIGLAVLAITLSLIAVFLPVAFMAGITGRFFYSFGITMACAIAVSMFVSFSLTPMLCSRWLTEPEPEPAAAGPAAPRHHDSMGGWFGRLEHAYGRLLEWSLRHRWAVISLSILVFASIFPHVRVMPKNFMPLDDESQFEISARAPEGTSVAGTRRILDAIAAELRDLPEVRLVLVTVGDDRTGTSNGGTIFVRLNEVEDREERSVTQFTTMAVARDQVLAKYQSRMQQLAVLKATSLTGGASYDVQFSVMGPDLMQLGRYADRLLSEVKQIPGVANVYSSLVTGKPELRATIDRARAQDLGVDVVDVAQGLRLAVAGDDQISSFQEGDEDYEVHMRLEETYRQNAEDLTLLAVPTVDGQGQRGTVTLDQVVNFQRGSAPATIERQNRQPRFQLRVNLIPGASQGAVTEQVTALLEGLKLPPGYRYLAVGSQREFKTTFTNFLKAFLMSFLIMYLVVAAQFESFVHALTIMVTLPLTVPFALLSLLLAGNSLNVFSMLGMLVLLGVVKKNAILQVDRANQLRAAGLSLHDATVKASQDRLRPILMTTLAFVAGMIPLVLARGTGAGISRTTGGVIVGGQTFSLLLTLVAAPVFYVQFDHLLNSRWLARWRRPQPPAQPAADEEPEGERAAAE